MKSIICFFVVFLLLITQKLVRAEDMSHGELFIQNFTTGKIIVKVYPVGCVFNGDKKYKLQSRFPNVPPSMKYVIGGTSPELTFESRMYLEFDGSESPGNYHGNVGYGIYKIDIYLVHDEGEPESINYCYIDFSSFDYPYYGHPYLYADVGFEYRSGNVITHNGGYSLPEDRTVKVWDQRQWRGPNAYEPQNKNGFVTTNEDNGKWLKFPIKTSDLESPYNQTTHITSEKLFVFLEVLYNHIPFVKCGKTFEVTNASRLNVFNGSQFNVGNECSGKLQINTGGLLWGTGGCSINVKPYSELRLKKNSNVSLWNNGHIYMQPRSAFCDEGANISGRQNIHFQGTISICANPTPDYCYFEDSVKVMLEDTATLNIPDSSTWIFQGSETAMLCDSGSTIKLGKNSKLIFQDGARINAKHTKFTTYDSNTTWNGIYLSDVSYDTLQYCTIENALNGINIEDKYSLFTSAPATEISNCEFSNKTSGQLLNMVYVNNSANVMIRNCTSTSLINDGFASGVIIEYSTAGGVNVIDNEIEYVTTGINVIQSSPYIARNTINGSATSGTGIYLDNSNGTIEYNIVNNFENSIKLYYSSPYVLKNTFNAGNSSDAYVTAYSAPVMKPVVSGTTLRWLGGNNYFTGQPGTAGIILESEGHPLMDSGYNVVSVGNSLYMQGTISRTLYLRVNNWYDDPPVSQKFDISGETIDYSEYFDGQSLPGTDYYELNEIGFGYNDTVYVKDIGGDNLTAEQIFILAYRKEMERKFVEAIVLYKNVITAYKNSNYAVSSVSRIFNCLEKSKAGNNAYNAVKTYYDGLKNSNTYPIQVREVAEDLAIKAKVRMGFLEEAISDYQTIINNNQNNPKGIHAQVNKLVLMNMNNGGDNIMFGNKQKSENYKANLLSFLTGKKIQAENKITNNIPGQFKLYQNYPNPFNPKTSIKYEIPVGTRHGVFVQLKIYDITGREILSITEYKQAGSYSYTFDGTNYASGLYLYRLEVRQAGSSTGNYVETKKMVLMK